MTDRPKIEVGQKWVTRGGQTVRIVATVCNEEFPIMGYLEDTHQADFYALDGTSESTTRPEFNDFDLISLAPSTVKREVALYRHIATGSVDALDVGYAWRLNSVSVARISEPVEIEFTLLPGENAE